MGFEQLFSNEVLLIAGSAWGLAQLIKVVLGRVHEKRIVWRYFISTGGMPSAHSATVSALATGIAATQGLDSGAFAIAAILAIVVMYDAAGLRQAVSEQARVLNRLLWEFREKRPRSEMERDLRELIGHTPYQVFIGSALGIAIALVWLNLASWLA